MTREESAKWASLLQAQAYGKTLERMDDGGVWHTSKPLFIDFVMDVNRWRIAPDLPPKPSQEWLDKHGVELTGECREPLHGELVHGLNALNEFLPDYSPLLVDGGDYGDRWILRRRAPQVKPWTIDTVPMPLAVREHNCEACKQVLEFHPAGVFIAGDAFNLITWEALLRTRAQRDGSPCGEVVK